MKATAFVASALAAHAVERTIIPKTATPDFGPDFVPSHEDNMNGEYPIATTPKGKPGLFPKRFRDYPGGAESYDYYSPVIRSLYSQVFWTPLAPKALPEEMVKKYAGKKAAIIGWEIDQVRKTPQGDVSVPISASYNHHYCSTLSGAGAKFKKVMLSGPDDPRSARVIKGHGGIQYDQPQYIAEEVDPVGDFPSTYSIQSANGGEYRKSYHGFPPGYALVLDSPAELLVMPMQIDTWNRDEMNISGPMPPKFVAGPLPRASLAPKDAPYSGLLECPITTRLSRQIDGTYTTQNELQCSLGVNTAEECFAAASSAIKAGVNQTFQNAAVSSSILPPGCSVVMDQTPLDLSITFNSQPSSVPCGKGAVQLVAATQNLLAKQDVVSVEVVLDLTAATTTLTLSGPSDRWFGAGFNATAMKDNPWTLVCDGNGKVTERQLGDQNPGTALPASVKVVSNTVTDGRRTVVLQRPMQGKDARYYTFASDVTALDYINAVGSGADFAYHKDKMPSKLTFLPSGAVGACVCAGQPAPFGQQGGSLVYNKVANQTADIGAGAVGLRAGKCRDWPQTDLIQKRNPTCDVRYYQGGQWACHHMWSLLDADQEIPWTDQPLEFYHKYRFWVQPYDESYHTAIHYGLDTELLIGSPYEFDVPKCDASVPGCELTNGTWVHTIRGNTVGHHSFTAMNFHCHAPTCMSMEVWACPKSTALGDCNETIAGAELLCKQEPLHGGYTPSSTINGTKFNELGYIAIPGCFWGSAANGLEAPPNLEGVPLHMIKKSNATVGHYGEMAGGQPWVF